MKQLCAKCKIRKRVHKTQSYCSPCNAEYHKQYRDEHPDYAAKRNDFMKQYYKTHKEQWHAWYVANKARRRVYNRKRYQKLKKERENELANANTTSTSL